MLLEATSGKSTLWKKSWHHLHVIKIHGYHV